MYLRVKFAIQYDSKRYQGVSEVSLIGTKISKIMKGYEAKYLISLDNMVIGSSTYTYIKKNLDIVYYT